MNSRTLIESLKKKLDVKTHRELAKLLGFSELYLSQWYSEPRELTALQVSNLILKAKARGAYEAHHYSIKPIVEYYQIEAEETSGGKKWELFNSKISKFKQHEDIKTYLKKKKGVYIFYDSQGRALYVGKAKKQSLWSEINNAFNRDRETQKIRLVSHPTNDVKFVPAFKSTRAIRHQHIKLHDMAEYFSAYEIDKNLIDNAEALLIRSFANGLLNAKSENFTKNV